MSKRLAKTDKNNLLSKEKANVILVDWNLNKRSWYRKKYVLIELIEWLTILQNKNDPVTTLRS